MTLPTQTWRLSAEYNIAMAGATVTPTELIQAINDAFVAENTIGNNLWMVSAFDVANKQLELKRKGSPAGSLGTFRALLFGGVSPNAAAIFSAMATGVTTKIYCGVAENANTTGPATLYSVGAPYTSGQKYSGAVPWGTYTGITAANAPKVLIVECDRMCAVVIKDNLGMTYTLFGEIVERLLDNVGLWGCFTSMDRYVTTTILDSTSNTASPYPLTTQAASTGPPGAYYDGAAMKCLSRAGGGTTQTVADCIPFSNSGLAILNPVFVGERYVNAVSQVILLGQLRQMRYGPYEFGKKRIFNGASALQGYSINGGGTVAGTALIFDNSP